MENKTYSRSPAIQVYGKQIIFELSSHTGLWKTKHIQAPPPYRFMEKRTDSNSPAIQIDGKQIIF
jgi:hypothetical protein